MKINVYRNPASVGGIDKNPSHAWRCDITQTEDGVLSHSGIGETDADAIGNAVYAYLRNGKPRT